MTSYNNALNKVQTCDIYIYIKNNVCEFNYWNGDMLQLILNVERLGIDIILQRPKLHCFE